jgi:hypothetical protein
MNTPLPYPDVSDCSISAARLNAIADRTAAHYPSLAAELRRIARETADAGQCSPDAFGDKDSSPSP